MEGADDGKAIGWHDERSGVEDTTQGNWAVDKRGGGGQRMRSWLSMVVDSLWRGRERVHSGRP